MKNRFGEGREARAGQETWHAGGLDILFWALGLLRGSDGGGMVWVGVTMPLGRRRPTEGG